MRFIFFIVLTICLNPLSAQESPKFFISLGANYGTGTVRNKLDFEIPTTQYMTIVEKKYTDKKTVNYTLEFGYNLNTHTSLVSGIGYLPIQQDYFTNTTIINNPQPPFAPRTRITYESTMKLGYIYLPLFFQKTFGNNSNKFLIQFGANFAYNISVKDRFITRFFDMDSVNNGNEVNYQTYDWFFENNTLTDINTSGGVDAKSYYNIVKGHVYSKFLILPTLKIGGIFKITDKICLVPNISAFINANNIESGRTIDINYTVDSYNKFNQVKFNWNYAGAKYINAFRSLGSLPIRGRTDYLRLSGGIALQYSLGK